MRKKIDFAAEGARIRPRLEENRYAFADECGLTLYADASEIVFSESIAREGAPVDAALRARLESIEAFYLALVSGSEAFRAFAEGKRFVASLDVESGPMSFAYAQLVDGAVFRR